MREFSTLNKFHVKLGGSYIFANANVAKKGKSWVPLGRIGKIGKNWQKLLYRPRCQFVFHILLILCL